MIRRINSIPPPPPPNKILPVTLYSYATIEIHHRDPGVTPKIPENNSHDTKETSATMKMDLELHHVDQRTATGQLDTVSKKILTLTESKCIKKFF